MLLISIVGLSIVQYQYLRIGLNLAKVQFKSKIVNVADKIEEELSTENKLSFLLASALRKDTTFFTISSDSLNKVSGRFLNDCIGEQLTKQGLESEYSFRLYSKDSVYQLDSPRAFAKDDTIDSYPIVLEGYLSESLDKPIVLELQFKNLYGYFLSKLNGLTLPSLLFLLGICATVIWVLRTYYWQSKIITITNEFINNLTHELKTPVFSIGLATKLLDENADKKQKVFLTLIRQQVNRLSGHIDKVLELGSLESGKRILTLKTVDFKPHLLSVCEEFQTLISIEEGDFSFDFRGNDYIIKAELFHLENAINNILDNSKKYSERPVIKLEAFVRNGRLNILISDNGKGVSQDNKHRIFQKYYRVMDGDLHKVKGYGLGLSYVKKVIEKHKGKVVIQSEELKGTEITLIIPLKK